LIKLNKRMTKALSHFGGGGLFLSLNKQKPSVVPGAFLFVESREIAGKLSEMINLLG